VGFSTDNQWCLSHPGVCTSTRLVFTNGEDLSSDSMSSIGINYVEYGAGRVYSFSPGVINVPTVSDDNLVFGPVVNQMRKNLMIDAGVDTSPEASGHSVTVNLPTQLTTAGRSVVADVKLTYSVSGSGITEEFICSRDVDVEFSCVTQVPTGTTVVLEFLQETPTDNQKVCNVGDGVVSNLGSFSVNSDILIDCIVPADSHVVKLRFPKHDRVTRGNIRTLVANGGDMSECRSNRRRLTCDFIVQEGDTFTIENLEGNASYSIPSRPKNLEEGVDLEITEDTTIYVSNGEVVVTVHGFASSVSGEMVCFSNVEMTLLASLIGGGSLATLSDLNQEDIWFQFFPSLIKMRDDLRRKGFQVEEFNYDWRQDWDVTADKLKTFVEAVQANRGKKVHIGAHSMGGLISRVLIQSDNRDSVQSIAFIGTPHLGSVDAVYMHGGDFKSWSGFFSTFKLEFLLDSMRRGCDYSLNDEQFIRQEIPAAKSLLPIVPHYAYATHSASKGDPIPLDSMCTRNTVLENLNADASSLITSSVPMKVFASSNKRTILRVSNRLFPPSSRGCDPDVQWPDYRPEKSWRPKKSGDGTVPFGSAYPVDVIPAFESIPYELYNGKHSDLPGKSKVINGLVDFFRENATQ